MEQDKLYYIYQHFQDNEKQHEIDPNNNDYATNSTLYPKINNNIEYGIFENIIDSYYLNSQIKEGFHCDKTCYSDEKKPMQITHQ